MAFDPLKPATADNYSTGFTQGIRANLLALALWLDSTNVTFTGTIPTYTKRYNRTSGFIEEYGGSAWGNLTVNIPGNAATATSAGKLAAGVAGAIPWQSAPGVTAFTAAGTAGMVLVSNGPGAPSWTASPTFSTPALGTPASGNLANCSIPFSNLTGVVPTWNQNTTGNAATATNATTAATCSGNAATATTANGTNFSTSGGGVVGYENTLTVKCNGYADFQVYANNLEAGLFLSGVGYVFTATRSGVVTLNGTASNSLGVGQSYQLNGGAISRSLGTTYTNSSNKPRTVIVVVTATGGSTGGGYGVAATVAGVNFSLVSAVQGYALGGGTFVVPPGATYSVSMGVAATLTGWSELS